MAGKTISFRGAEAVAVSRAVNVTAIVALAFLPLVEQATWANAGSPDSNRNDAVLEFQPSVERGMAYLNDIGADIERRREADRARPTDGLGRPHAAARLAAQSTDARPIGPDPGQGYVRLPGHVLDALAQATLAVPQAEVPLSPEASADQQELTLTLVLKRDDPAGFERYLRDVYDPGAERYHKFLTPEQLAERFGPSRENYGAVLSYLRRQGFTLIRESKDRMTLTVRGTRQEAERAFAVQLRDYRIGDRDFYANHNDPALPAEFASHVEAIGGLSNLARPRPQIKAIGKVIRLLCNFPLFAGAAIPVGQETLQEAQQRQYNACAAPINKTFGIESTSPTLGFARVLSSAGLNFNDLDGAGQTVGLVAFDRFEPSDVADYLAFIGAPASRIDQVDRVPVAGGATFGPNQAEVLLDINAVLTIAPAADVVVYDAPFEGPGVSFQGLFNAMIDDGVGIISNSWAYCEDQTTLADVQSIEAILQTAAASGISIFSAAGDTGSTCLDGSPNTVAVPASSPSITAVGGTSRILGPGSIYESESWWDGTSDTPLTGQGGFGISRFFPRPAYQDGINSSPMRSIPDVSFNADPALGALICQAVGGGCPTGLVWGGTSVAAPIWAGITALLNQAHGSNLGNFNELLYPLAGTDAFHGPDELGSDFAHVGLGSPNPNLLSLLLNGETAGAVDAAESSVKAYISFLALTPPPDPTVAADGLDAASVVVRLLDANGNLVSGKTVILEASSANVTIAPPSAVTDVASGAAVFTVTTLTPETVTFTAMDTTDGIALADTASVPFVVPPAASAGITSFPTTVTADGVSSATITVTLQDSLGRPTPGKRVTLDQMTGSGGGHSAITAPTPSVTDSNGQISFQVTNLVTENVTYTATDVSDGNLPVPGNATVEFTNGPGGCATNQPFNVVGSVNTANGFKASTFASGFTVNSGFLGFSFNCFGAWGMAWDAAGNLYVTEWPTGQIFKFGPSGGIADASHLFTTVQAPASGVAIDPAGNMFASEASVSGSNGDIVPVDLSTGTVGTAIASGIGCLGSMVLDPTIPALYAINFCNIGQAGSHNIWQVTGIDGPSPSTTVYAQVPSSNVENLQLAVAPDGTLYDLFCTGSVGCEIARVSTDSPPVVTTLATADGTPITLFGSLGIATGGMQPSGDAQFIILGSPEQNGLGEGIQTIDLTGTAPAPAVQITTSFPSALSNYAIGPDGCLYIAGGPTVQRITNLDDTCDFGPQSQPPIVSLTPNSVSPNPAQGASQNFIATTHYAAVPEGTPVILAVSGANPEVQMARTGADGVATFSYTGINPGDDTALAFATVNDVGLNSNLVQVTWDPGVQVTDLSLNLSPQTGTVGESVTLIAQLINVSASPVAPLPDQLVRFELGGESCTAITDMMGIASCGVILSAAGNTLSASYDGVAGSFTPASDTRGILLPLDEIFADGFE